VSGTELETEYFRLSMNELGFRDGAFSSYGYSNLERWGCAPIVLGMYRLMVILVDLRSLPSLYSHAE
jgi:hypothetical protein